MRDKERSRVSVVRCGTYGRDEVFASVKRALDLLGGIRAFIKPGSTVLIKPNLLKASPPGNAVVTHPEIVRAVVRLVHEAGGSAVIGDSPGIGDLRRVCAQCGIMDVVTEEGARLADMDGVVRIRNRGQFRYFEVARSVHEADAVINLPKLKTHGMLTLTGAVKNLFGCIPGPRKVQWHFNAGINRSAFARMLVELCALVNPVLTVMDAVVGMEGNGPGSGSPREIGVVLAGPDPVAVDIIAGGILGADPLSLHTARAAANAGIGETRTDRITVLGENVQAVRVSNFRFPHQEHVEWRLPEWARRLLKDALTTRPIIDHGRCARCGICQGHCPQGAVSDRKGCLAIDYRACIRCFCCQEFCPHGAITVGRGWALTLLQ